ncbi:hypothetical protein D3C81_2065970 [compost metagenome]
MRRAQEAIDQGFILAVQDCDDLLLVGKVVIEVTGRDLHMRGDMVGADAALTLLVKQLQAVLHDALAGFQTRGHDCFQA